MLHDATALSSSSVSRLELEARIGLVDHNRAHAELSKTKQRMHALARDIDAAIAILMKQRTAIGWLLQQHKRSPAARTNA